MPELIHEPTVDIKVSDGAAYKPRIYAEQRADNTWEAWIEFYPTDKRKPVLRTGQETSQPDRPAIEYWALGLKPIYFEGAFARAQRRFI
ncbi:MAG TPA: hypothetical protein VJA94_09230 [Candidatus Angelobacter sp.]